MNRIAVFGKPGGGKSTLSRQLSAKFWTPELFEEMKRRGNDKTIYRIISVKEMNLFIKKFER